MSKVPLTLFLCTGKDCSKAWRHVCHGSPSKWLKRQIEHADLPYRLHIVKTECMDLCEEAANLWCVHGASAGRVSTVRSADDADRVLAHLRACAENADRDPGPSERRVLPEPHRAGHG
jgi:hypothetical protein